MKEKKDNPDEEQNSQSLVNISSQPTTPPIHQVPESKIPKYYHGNNSNNRKDHFVNWRIGKETRESLLVWLNILMLFAFIGFSWRQSYSTREALNIADSANSKTQESINISNSMLVLADSARRQNREQLEITKDNNRKAIAFADSAFKSSKKSSQVYEYLTKSDLRAYVNITERESITMRVGDYIKTQYEIVNSGKTPALNFLPYNAIFAVCDNDSAVITHGYNTVCDAIKRHTRDEMVLSTSVPFVKQTQTALKMNEIDSLNIQSGKCNICLIIGIFYKDIFGRPHHTFYCSITGKDTDIEKIYPKYNWAD